MQKKIMKIDTNFGKLTFEKVGENEYKVTNEKAQELACAHKEGNWWKFRYLNGSFVASTREEGVQIIGEHYAKIKQMKIVADALGLQFWHGSGWLLWAKDLLNKKGKGYIENTTLSVWYKKNEAIYGIRQYQDGTFIGEYKPCEAYYEAIKSEPTTSIEGAMDFIKKHI